MGLLAEYAVTPDVFDSACYSSQEVCGLHLQNLKDALLNDGLVRDLRDGEWRQPFVDSQRTWHQRGRELLKKLVEQSRLVRFPPSRGKRPDKDSDWCHEALATHAVTPLSGVIVTETAGHPENPLVSPVHKLSGAPWWAARSPSLRLGRSLPEYKGALRLILSHANSVMFIDPHLDPRSPRYASFLSLAEAAGGRSPPPKIEVHRVRYVGSGPARDLRPIEEWEDAFRRVLVPRLNARGLTAEVFIWNDFHDRYLISNLVGISMQNGFDTTSSRDRTTWSRLGRSERDDVQRDFDPAANRHELKHRFTIP